MRVTSVHGYGELLERGLATHPLVTDTHEAVLELGDRLREPDVALFVNATRPAAFLIAENNRSAFVGACVVVHFYAERPGLLRGLLEELRAFALAGEMTRFHGCDINQLTESGYRRLLKGMPSELRRIGALYEVRG